MDEVTWQEYEQGLEEHLGNLHRRVHRGSYRAQPVREPSAEQGRWLRQVIEGYYNYHAVPGNLRALRSFRRGVARHGRQALRRRSQRSCRRWEDFVPLVKQYLPWPSVRHGYPLERFAAIYPR